MVGGKEHILNCAFNLFLKKGYEKTSMMDLVKVSNLSKGAFYHHFQSKEILFRAVVDHFFMNFFNEYETANGDFDLFAYIEITWKSYSNLLIKLSSIIDDLSVYHRFLYTIFDIFPDIKEQINVQLRESKKQLEDGFTRLQFEGKIRKNNSPQSLSTQLLSMIEGLGIIIAMENDIEIENTFRATIESFIESITLSD